ncbi:hypothetical protein J4403_00015 [Candidatus Woesearchaeota archaeon]|nr:hypothetical protein [Candidatus Woesearchaeota archaeon]
MSKESNKGYLVKIKEDYLTEELEKKLGGHTVGVILSEDDLVYEIDFRIPNETKSIFHLPKKEIEIISEKPFKSKYKEGFILKYGEDLVEIEKVIPEENEVTYQVKYLDSKKKFETKPKYFEEELKECKYGFQIGDKVRVKESVDEPKYKWDTLDHNAVGEIVDFFDTEDKLVINFPNYEKWYGHAPEMELVSKTKSKKESSSKYGFSIGDKVRVKESVDEPKEGWGHIHHDSVGEVVGFKLKDGESYLEINFPEHGGWAGYASEMELVDGKKSRKKFIPIYYGNVVDEDELISLSKIKMSEILDDLILEKYKLLAGAKIDLQEIDKDGCPATDGKRIYLPESIDEINYSPQKGKVSPKFNPNTSLYIANLYHEASHLRYGSFGILNLTDFLESNFENPELAKALINILEDERVEHYFKSEFKRQERMPKLLEQEVQFYASKHNIPEDDLIALIDIFQLKLRSGKTMGERKIPLKEKEDKLLVKEIKNPSLKKEGIQTYKDLYKKMVSISSNVRDVSKNVSDSVKYATKVYKLLEKEFPQSVKQLPKENIPGREPSESINDFDSGGIKIKDEKDLEKSKKKIDKLTEKVKEKFGVEEPEEEYSEDQKSDLDKDNPNGDKSDKKGKSDRGEIDLEDLKKKLEEMHGRGGNSSQGLELKPIIEEGLIKKGYSPLNAKAIAESLEKEGLI